MTDDIDDYFESERASSGLRGADLAKDDVFARAARGVRDVMRRLDALPRDGAFRTTTSRHAMLHKAAHYASVLVTRDPTDAQAWWCFVGLGLWWCNNDFGSAGFKGLHALGQLDAAWPVSAALEVYLSSGFDPVKILVRLVAELGIARGAHAALAELAKVGGPTTHWSNGVLAEMSRRDDATAT